MEGRAVGYKVESKVKPLMDHASQPCLV